MKLREIIREKDLLKKEKKNLQKEKETIQREKDEMEQEYLEFMKKVAMKTGNNITYNNNQKNMYVTPLWCATQRLRGILS